MNKLKNVSIEYGKEKAQAVKEAIIELQKLRRDIRTLISNLPVEDEIEKTRCHRIDLFIRDFYLDRISRGDLLPEIIMETIRDIRDKLGLAVRSTAE